MEDTSMSMINLQVGRKSTKKYKSLDKIQRKSTTTSESTKKVSINSTKNQRENTCSKVKRDPNVIIEKNRVHAMSNQEHITSQVQDRTKMRKNPILGNTND